MSKEISFPGRVIAREADPNCLTGSIDTILRLLSQLEHLNQDKLFKALPRTNDWAVANFIDLLRREGFVDFDHEIIEIRKRKTILHRVLTDALQGGAVIEIAVKSIPWIKGVRKNNCEITNPNSIHSIVIYGYYQPGEKIENTWFYIADSYAGDHHFVPLEKINSCLDQSGGYSWLNVFDLCLDHSNLIGDKAIGGIVSRRYQKYILRRLPQRSYHDKLSSLFEQGKIKRST